MHLKFLVKLNEMNLRNKLYTIWCCLVVMGTFLLLYPFIFLSLQKESWKIFAHKLNYLWFRVFCFFAGIKIEIKREFTPNPKETYIFCGSHFSPIDNFTVYLLAKNYFCVIGDEAIGKLPLYGYMFRKLNITVDRKNQKSRNAAMLKAIKVLRSGRSILISPEGGIASRNPPNLYYPFEDGAFILAIHRQVPIVPLTSTTTYQIVPDVKNPLIYRRPLKATIHKPIETKGMTMADLERLKEMTFRVMNEGLGNVIIDSEKNNLVLEEIAIHK
jgi:1-acyl-sn-glycerol-3-phosphate acyltransferase